MSMETKYTGGCLCGSVRYTCASDPVFSLDCHCKDCQRSSGGAYVPAMVFAAANVEVTGTPMYYARKGDSGRTIERGFCPQCGAGLFAKLEVAPGQLVIRAGSLDDASRFDPKVNFFVASAQPWDEMNAALPKVARAPGG